MSRISEIEPPRTPPVSPLMLSDRLLTLAQDADRAGYQLVAEHLLHLASEVLDGPMRGPVRVKH